MSSERGTSKAVWRTLGEVCIVVAGGTPSKKDASYWEHGTIKWLGSTVCQNQKNIETVIGLKYTKKYESFQGHNK